MAETRHAGSCWNWPVRFPPRATASAGRGKRSRHPYRQPRPASQPQRTQLEQSDVISFHDYGWPESFERRVAQLKAYLDVRFSRMEEKLEQHDGRFDELDARRTANWIRFHAAAGPAGSQSVAYPLML